MIFSGKKSVRLETQRKKLTVFSDIRGFTELSEELEAEALTDLLNNYLNEMSKIALKYGGTIDKFVGDCVMVFFGDPSTQGAKKDAVAAVSMGIAMRKHMKVLRQQWRAQGITKPLEIRMGINTGYCTVGNFGADTRMDYTIIGREVNLASRLESASEAGEILISHETYSLIKDVIMCRDKGQIAVKGFSRPVQIYQVVDSRRDLGAAPSYVEHELPGFSMYLDTNNIQNYDKERVIQAPATGRRTPARQGHPLLVERRRQFVAPFRRSPRAARLQRQELLRRNPPGLLPRPAPAGLAIQRQRLAAGFAKILVHDPGHALLQYIQRPRHGEGRHRHAAGQCFEHHQAIGIGQRGKHQHRGRPVGVGQCAAMAVAEKTRLWIALLQRRPLRAVAHQPFSPGSSRSRNASRFFSVASRPTYRNTGGRSSAAGVSAGWNSSVSTPLRHSRRCWKRQAQNSSRRRGCSPAPPGSADGRRAGRHSPRTAAATDSGHAGIRENAYGSPR